MRIAILFALLLSLLFGCSQPVMKKLDKLETVIIDQSQSLTNAIAYQQFLATACNKQPTKPIKDFEPQIVEQGKQLAETKKGEGELLSQINPLKSQVQTMESKWYVVWGKRIEVFLWLAPILGIVVLFGVALKDSGITGIIPTVCVGIYRLVLVLVTAGIYPLGLICRAVLRKWNANRSKSGENNTAGTLDSEASERNAAG